MAKAKTLDNFKVVSTWDLDNGPASPFSYVPFPYEEKKMKDPSKGFIVAYSSYSKGAREVGKKLDIPVYSREQIAGSVPTLFPKAPFVINWGCAGSKFGKTELLSYFQDAKKINPFEVVDKCASKKKFFELMNGKASIPEFTTSIEVAKAWVSQGHTVLGRKEHGSAGKDIAFFDEDPEGFLVADLWLQYKKKKSEYRLHFIGNEIVMIQQKVLPKNDPDGNPIPKGSVDFRVRTHRTGFIFIKQDVNPPSVVIKEATKAWGVLKDAGLSFGAIDVIYNAPLDKAWVLECNTAPGLEATSIDTYAAKLKELVA
jgi:hypothetical protein